MKRIGEIAARLVANPIELVAAANQKRSTNLNGRPPSASDSLPMPAGMDGNEGGPTQPGGSERVGPTRDAHAHAQAASGSRKSAGEDHLIGPPKFTVERECAVGVGLGGGLNGLKGTEAILNAVLLDLGSEPSAVRVDALGQMLPGGQLIGGVLARRSEPEVVQSIVVFDAVGMVKQSVRPFPVVEEPDQPVSLVVVPRNRDYAVSALIGSPSDITGSGSPFVDFPGERAARFIEAQIPPKFRNGADLHLPAPSGSNEKKARSPGEVAGPSTGQRASGDVARLSDRSGIAPELKLIVCNIGMRSVVRRNGDTPPPALRRPMLRVVKGDHSALANSP